MRSAVALCAAGFPGAASALGELAEATGLIHGVRLRRAETRAAERRFVSQLLESSRVRLLIVGGWSRLYDPFIALAHRRDVPVAVYWTSTCGQTGMSQEIDRLAACLADRRVTHYWFIQRVLAEALQGRVKRSVWLPAVIANPGRRSPARSRAGCAARAAALRSGVEAEIGLFCSPLEYARKNVLTALTAVSRLDRPVRLHLNGLSKNRAYRGWLDRLDVPWIDHGWMTRERYLEAVRGLDVGVQMSFSESFNYVAADHVLAGVPIVVSGMVPSVVTAGAAARPFVVSNADDAESVARTVARLLARPAWAHARTSVLRTRLIEAQRAALRRARRVVEHAIGVP